MSFLVRSRMGANETETHDRMREQDCDDHQRQDKQNMLPSGHGGGIGLRECEGEIWAHVGQNGQSVLNVWFIRVRRMDRGFMQGRKR